MRNVHRVLVSLGAGLLLSLPISTLSAGTAGRDYARCNTACNQLRQACDRNCQNECKQLYPNNSGQERSCQTECKDSCMSEEKDCKLRCKAIKNGETFEEP